MEENQELQDIILDKEEDQGTSKARKIITTVISLVILFLIVVIVVKFLNSGDEPSDNMANNEALILPEEPVMPAPVNQPQSFEQVPIAVEPNTTNMPSRSSVDYQSPKIVTDSDLIVPITNDTVPITTPSAQSTQPMAAKSEATQTPKPQAKETLKPQANTTAPKPQQSAAQAKATAPKEQVTPKATAAPKAAASKPAPKASAPSASSTKVAAGTYVQVASLSKLTPNNAFLKKITDAGYSYKIYETSVNGKGTVKVLIGPFTQGELNENIGKIKADISNNAFIYRVK